MPDQDAIGSQSVQEPAAIKQNRCSVRKPRLPPICGGGRPQSPLSKSVEAGLECNAVIKRSMIVQLVQIPVDGLIRIG
jgi:hypothetical protein